MGEAAAVASGERDPREYLVDVNDVGCEFKVKCKPIRSDGYKGEVFTSKSCGRCVESMLPNSTEKSSSITAQDSGLL